MAGIVAPTQDQLSNLVARYLATQPQGLGIAVGYAGPDLPNQGGLFFAGTVANQFGTVLTLDADTPFLLASVSKTFTATLYALLIRSVAQGQTLGDYITPNGPLPISRSLAGITLDSLMSYTSGLPQDNVSDGASAPPYLPQPYSLDLMLSYLDTNPPTLATTPGYTYSNLGFAIMGAVLGTSGAGTDAAWLRRFMAAMRRDVFAPLGMQSSFFNEASLATLPQGYNYGSGGASGPWAVGPGWPLFPAYFGAGGIVATAADMMQWLQFNMGILQDETLTPLLPALQQPATSVTWGNTGLGLGWFITPASGTWAGSVWKDGDLAGTNTYIAFLPSGSPGTVASAAGVFVLVNADGINGSQKSQGVELPCVLANDILSLMQGNQLPADKTVYAPLSSATLRRPAGP